MQKKKQNHSAGFWGMLKILFFSPGRAASGRVGLLILPLVLVITAMVNQADRQAVPDPQEELAAFKIAEGFEVTLFAAEPLVIKPIQMNWDADGRLWVVSSTAYPHLKTGEQANDKVFVLEDTNGDGRADKSTVFAEGLLTPTGILPGDGGVYVANSTEILHLADTDQDGKADKRRVVLSGFGTADTHHLIHTFRWGPEASLYFNQSIYIYSHVETPAGVKRLEGGGVWQLRPETLDLNVYAKGLINPWGLQFNRWGQSFLTDGAGNEGINYGFPGATFLTSPGAERIIRGLNPGQPKHSGLDIASGRHLPEAWQGSLLTNDFRANRINRFRLEEQGSGYAAKQVEDLLWTDHVAFRPVDISVGPDGAIYVADWYNPIIQHGEVDFHDPRRDQAHGRIWRIVAKNRPLVKKTILSKATVPELLEALKLPEDWTRAQAKQVLKARGAREVTPALQTWLQHLNPNDPDYEHQLLEGLWVHQALNVVNEPLLRRLLTARQHQARAAGIRALHRWHPQITQVPALLAQAVTDVHPQVRLEAVMALRLTPTAEAARTALAVLDQPMDEFLDYSLWYTLRELEPQLQKKLLTEPDFLGNAQKTAFALKSMQSPAAVAPLLALYQKKQVPAAYHPDVLNAIAKRGSPADLNLLFEMALQGYAHQDKQVAAQLNALAEAARQRGVQPSNNLNRLTTFTASSEEAIALPAVRLMGYWRLPQMQAHLTRLVQHPSSNMKKAALAALVDLDKTKGETYLINLAQGKSAEVKMLATAQLATLNAPAAARLGAELLRTMPPKTDVGEWWAAFLAHKPATQLLAEALLAQKIPLATAQAVRPVFQRQIPWGRHNSPDVRLLIKALEASGGFMPAERMPQQLSSQEINRLAVEIKGNANPELGEAVFRKSNCGTCHAIGGAGGQIGPDLSSLGTSSPVETIINSILYPANSIKEGYELQRVVKTDGTETMGYLVSNGASEIVMRDATGKSMAIAKSQISALEKIPGSLMPPGLTANLEKEAFNQLVSFLSKLGESGPYRVPTARWVRRWEAMPAPPESARKPGKINLAQLVQGTHQKAFVPLYSRVAGSLPLAELPVSQLTADQKISVVRFTLEVLQAGKVNLAFNNTAGISAWAGSTPLTLTPKGVLADLPQGTQVFTLVINRNVRPAGELSVQVPDAAPATAQTRLVMGP